MTGRNVGPDGIDAYPAVIQEATRAWEYTRYVQPALVDMSSAYAEGDWALCVESAALVLQSVVRCQAAWSRGRRILDPVSFAIHVATDSHPAAGAMRTLAWSESVSEAMAHEAQEIASRHAESLRSTLLFELPDIRSPGANGPTVRIVAELIRLRKELGLGPVDWVE